MITLSILLLLSATYARSKDPPTQDQSNNQEVKTVSENITKVDRQIDGVNGFFGSGECKCADVLFSVRIKLAQVVVAAKVLSVHYVPDFTDGGPSPQYPLAEYTLEPLLYFKNRGVITSPTFQVHTSTNPKDCRIEFGIGEEWLFILSGSKANGGRSIVGHCGGTRKWSTVQGWKRELLGNLISQENS